jgi:glycosyltransferase involved in cell wall biosynthesis
MSNLVSIIVPCYNQARFLPETLESVLAQSYNNWECIIVNDGSPDNTESVARFYCQKDNRFRYVYKENGGLSSARNAGIAEAKGDFIQFLDSDDLLDSGKLEQQVAVFTTNEDVDIVIGTSLYFKDGLFGRFYSDINLRTENISVMLHGSGNVILKRLLAFNQFSVSAPLLKVCVIRKIGLFDIDLLSYEDWDYWIRAALSECVFLSQEGGISLTYIRIHKNSMSWNYERMSFAYHQMMSKISNNVLVKHENGKALVDFFLSCKRQMVLFQLIEHSRQTELGEVKCFMNKWLIDNRISSILISKLSFSLGIVALYKYYIMLSFFANRLRLR